MNYSRDIKFFLFHWYLQFSRIKHTLSPLNIGMIHCLQFTCIVWKSHGKYGKKTKPLYRDRWNYSWKYLFGDERVTYRTTVFWFKEWTHPSEWSFIFFYKRPLRNELIQRKYEKFHGIVKRNIPIKEKNTWTMNRTVYEGISTIW